ncbi:MAG: META domain-containing protein [Bacteroidota bacterium]
MNKLTLIISIVSCCLLCSCKNDPTGGDIENTYWKLISIKEGNQRKVIKKGQEVTAVFANKQVSGNASCNRYFATYTTEGTALSIGTVGATKKLCEDMALEQSYLHALANTNGYSVKGNQLIIFADGEQMTFNPMSETEIEDIEFADGVGRLVATFPELQGDLPPHLYPIVRVDRPGNYPFTGTLIDPELYAFFDRETSEIWNSTGGDVMAVAQFKGFYIARVPGRYVSSDIALFRLKDGVLQRSETIAWAWCDEGWCNQQDAWLKDINQDELIDIVQHYSLTDDRGKIREERMTVLLQTTDGIFEATENFDLNIEDYKMADI